jgi:hypothetical protein
MNNHNSVIFSKQSMIMAVICVILKSGIQNTSNLRATPQNISKFSIQFFVVLNIRIS